MAERSLDDVDYSLRLCAKRLKHYRDSGDERSYEIEMAVIDRLLSERYLLEESRTAHARTPPRPRR